MIIHRTTYGLFYKESDKQNIIIDCKRSNNNARKIYHLIQNGQIKETYNYQNEKLIKQSTTQQDKLITQNQRNIAKGKPYET